MHPMLKTLGLKTEGKVVTFNATPAFYIEQTLKNNLGHLSKDGSLVVQTGRFTGRAAQDKYAVKTATTEKTIWWENNVHAMTPEVFEKLKTKAISYLNDQPTIHVTERSVGADKVHNLSALLITAGPSHALFSLYMFRDKVREFDAKRDFTILHVPNMPINPADFGTRSDTIIVTNFDTKTIIIVGTLYAGEIKKSIFSAMNYVLPESGLLPMHAGANKSTHGNDVSVFFGLSGTGKTTLSTDDGQRLIGDDEHGLSDTGVFNFEGGCYAKTIRLSQKAEPGIWKATNHFGALVENVKMNPETRTIDFDDASITENGRSSYPLSFIEEREHSGRAGVPNNMFFLSADAFGVLPPVAKLTKEQAMFYFVLGYTAKVAGTEVGVKEPSATFSPCFGAPFMMRRPEVYAELLGKYLDKHKIDVWLINTGWTKGPYGVGERFPIMVTREVIRSVQAGKLKGAPTEREPYLGLEIPAKLGTISKEILFPELSWKDPKAYATKAKDLAQSFHKHMIKFPEFYAKYKSACPL